VKQIRDKRKEVAYKKLLQSQIDDIETPSGSPNETTQGYTSKSQTATEPDNTIPFPDINAVSVPTLEGASISTDLPMIGTAEPEDRIDHYKTWILNTNDQALANGPANRTELEDFQSIYVRLISILKDIGAST
jgi:hypothetical protein